MGKNRVLPASALETGSVAILARDFAGSVSATFVSGAAMHFLFLRYS